MYMSNYTIYLLKKYFTGAQSKYRETTSIGSVVRSRVPIKLLWLSICGVHAVIKLHFVSVFIKIKR